MKSKSLVASLVSMIALNGASSFAQAPANNPAESSTPIPDVEKMVQDFKFQIQAELLGIDILVRSIETARSMHDHLDLVRRGGQKVVIPVALLGAASVGAYVQVGSALANKLGPDPAFWTEYKKLLKAEKDALLNHQAFKTVESENELNKVRAQILKELRISQRSLFRARRLIRGAGLVTTYLGGAALAAAVTGEGLMIVLGTEDLDRTVSGLKERAKLLQAQL